MIAPRAWTALFFLFASPSVLPQNVFRVAPKATTRNTEILWDTFGVPHIFAHDPRGLFYASGWAQMHNHGDLLLRLYGQARGRAAEYWGPSYADSDRWVRTMGIPARADEWEQLQGPVFHSYLEAFTEGINDYARQHPDQIDDGVEVVLPVVPGTSWPTTSA